MIGCLFLPYFLAAVTVKANPRWAGKPVIVGRDGKVVGFSRELKGQSLAGLSMARARGRCPDAVLAEYDRGLHLLAQEEYLEALRDFAPFIEPVDAQECFFDLSGSRVQEEMDRLGAWLGPRQWGPAIVGLGGNKLLAQLAAVVPGKKKRGKTAGFYSFQVETGREQEFMGRIPLYMDGQIAPRARKLLDNLGFNCFGDLDDLTPEDLVRLLGREEGHKVGRHRQGLDNTPLMGLYPPERIGLAMGFEGGVDDSQVLGQALGEGARAVALALRERNMSCRQVALELELEQQECRAERQLSRGCGEERSLVEVLAIMLAGLHRNGPAYGLRIEVSSLRELVWREQDLFSFDARSSRPRQDLGAVAEAMEARFPGMLQRGLLLDRREEVLSFWDPWRYRGREGRL